MVGNFAGVLPETVQQIAASCAVVPTGFDAFVVDELPVEALT
jgi:hypothetical protein